MVVISSPAWASASARHELMRRPSTSTVQAPHWPRSQPFFVPVRCRRSRSRSSRVTRGSSSSTLRGSPFTVRLIALLMRRISVLWSNGILGAPAQPARPLSFDGAAFRSADDYPDPARSKFQSAAGIEFGTRSGRNYYTEASSVLQGGVGAHEPRMSDQAVVTGRKPRADAARNRERVLEAAKAVFSTGGPDASLETVAKRAGVGIGTLYRHFPTREALFEAVYRREVEQLSELAERLKEEAEPVEALRQWMRSNVRFVATKKGMSAALALAAYKPSDLFSYSFDQLTRAVGGLLDRAIATGEIRDDISPQDLLRALVGMCYMHDQPGWQASVLRLVDVFVDGLRNPRGARRSKANPRRSR